jgi:hypothetical protein
MNVLSERIPALLRSVHKSSQLICRLPYSVDIEEARAIATDVCEKISAIQDGHVLEDW